MTWANVNTNRQKITWRWEKAKRAGNKPISEKRITATTKALPSGLINIRFRISQPLMDELRWQIGDRIDLYLGTDEHLGLLKLMLEMGISRGPRILRTGTQSLGWWRQSIAGDHAPEWLKPHITSQLPLVFTVYRGSLVLSGIGEGA